MTATNPLSSLDTELEDILGALYFNFLAASKTLNFVLLEMLAPLVKHLETADWDTPASFATSCDVAVFLKLMNYPPISIFKILNINSYYCIIF